MGDAGLFTDRIRIAGARRRTAILAGSIGFHVIILTAIGLELSDRDGMAQTLSSSTIYLDLEPWPDLSLTDRPIAVRPQVPRRAEAVPGPSTITNASGPSRPVIAASRETRPVRNPASAEDAEAWRLSSRPGPALRPVGPWGGDVCRDLSNLAAWLAANCQDRAPPPQIEARGSPPAAEARIGQRRLDSSEQRRENGFARQAAANEAWRAYRREDSAPYPGLRSMLRDQ